MLTMPSSCPFSSVRLQSALGSLPVPDLFLDAAPYALAHAFLSVLCTVSVVLIPGSLPVPWSQVQVLRVSAVNTINLKTQELP